jgi:acetyl-CoA carboxylase biotin carboxyl carrier protein
MGLLQGENLTRIGKPGVFSGCCQTLNIERIEAVAQILHESNRLTEIELRDGDTTLRLRRPAPPARPVKATPKPATETKTPSAASSGTLPRALGTGDTPVAITAQFVGVFHAHKQAVNPGDFVSAKQVVGHIESMRLLNDCVAPSAGRIGAVLVQDGQPVEWGQPLFEIVPDEEAC